MRRTPPAVVATARAAIAGAPLVLRERPVRLLWLAVAAGHTACGALVLGILVLLYNATSSAAVLGAALVAMLLPAVLVRLPPEPIALRLDARPAMIAGYGLCAVAALLLLLTRERTVLVLVWSFLFAAASQVAWQAEAAAASKHESTAAALAALTAWAGLTTGAVVVAPLLIKLAGSAGMLVAAALLFLLAALAAAMDRQHTPAPAGLSAAALRTMARDVLGAVRDGWRIVRTDWRIARALSCQVVMAALLAMLAVLGPVFADSVLAAAAEDVALLAAPAVLAVVAAVIVLGAAVVRGAMRRMATSLLAVGVTLALLGAAKTGGSYILYNVIGRVVDTRSAVIVLPIVLILSFGLGLACAALLLAAGVIMQSRRLDDNRTQLRAVQVAVVGVGSLAPLLLVGGVADLLGVNKTMVLLGLTVAAAGVIALREWEWDDEGDD